MGRPGLTRHRKFKRAARALDRVQPGFGDILARGALELLWDAAYENGDEFLGDPADVEGVAGWHGEEGLLVEALAAAGGEGLAGFIEEGGSPAWAEGAPGTYRVHDLWDHAPAYVQKRAEREAARVASSSLEGSGRWLHSFDSCALGKLVWSATREERLRRSDVSDSDEFGTIPSPWNPRQRSPNDPEASVRTSPCPRTSRWCCSASSRSSVSSCFTRSRR